MSRFINALFLGCCVNFVVWLIAQFILGGLANKVSWVGHLVAAILYATYFYYGERK